MRKMNENGERLIIYCKRLSNILENSNDEEVVCLINKKQDKLVWYIARDWAIYFCKTVDCRQSPSIALSIATKLKLIIWCMLIKNLMHQGEKRLLEWSKMKMIGTNIPPASEMFIELRCYIFATLPSTKLV